MSNIEFYKATSGGKLESVENSTNSLHYRRSILIQDDISYTIWLIHGSGVSDKTRKSAEDNAERIQNEGEAQYEIVRVDPDDAVDVIDEIFEKKENEISETKPSQPSKFSIDTLPKVPKVKSTDVDFPKPKGDDDVEGPEIKEFQIAYFKEEHTDTEVESELFKQVLQLISTYVKQVDDIIDTKPTKDSAQSMLHKLSDDIITLIYE